MDRDETVQAGGGVVVREGPEIAVVHRMRYDDWTLPKGKLEPGETAANAALREVAEETGIRCLLDRYLGESRYIGPGDKPKIAHYWLLRPVDIPPFEPNEEVDELRWLPPAEAKALLTHDRDRELVDEAIRLT